MPANREMLRSFVIAEAKGQSQADHAPAHEDERRSALAHFLRTRRARITPEDVGLPGSQRRRTPGLRREELALIADISATWYMWLEQGRPVNVSEHVLDRLAQALRLDPEERTHLFMLARGHEPPIGPACLQEVTPALQTALDHLNPCPAYVVSACFRIVAWNRAATLVFTDFETMAETERNWLRFLFLDQMIRERMVDWSGQTRRALATFRANSRRYVGMDGMETLVRELHANCEEFRAWWDAHEVLGGAETHTQIRHPQAGLLTFEAITLLLAQAPDQKMIVYTPVAGTTTERSLAQLLAGKV